MESFLTMIDRQYWVFITGLIPIGKSGFVFILMLRERYTPNQHQSSLCSLFHRGEFAFCNPNVYGLVFLNLKD